MLDTNVLVAGLRSRRGASHQILSLMPRRTFTPLVSVPLMLEYEDVLKRPEQLAVSGLTVDEIDTVLDMVAAVCEEVQLYYLWRPQLRDAADEMVLETAVSGSADAIVTFNVRDFEKGRQPFGIAVIEPRRFWRLIQEETR